MNKEFESAQTIPLNPDYLAGVRRQPPGVRRVYPSLRLDKELYNLNYSPKTDFLRQGELDQTKRLRRWQDGFVAGIEQDFAIKLSLWGIPSDDTAFSIFMDGLQGQSRALPPRKTERELEYNYYPTNPYRAAPDELYYKVGLRVWLASQGLVYLVSVGLIRDPKALQAFQAGLTGKVLSEFEEPKQPQLNLYKSDEYNNYKHNENLTIKSELSESWVLRFFQAKQAYRRGQELRFGKTTSTIQ